MTDWEIVHENHYENLSCRLDRIKVDEGYIYRHMTCRDKHDTANPEVALCFVEQKQE